MESQGIPATDLKHDALFAKSWPIQSSMRLNERVESSWIFHAWTLLPQAEAQSHAAKELPVTQPKAFLPHLPKNRWDGHLRRFMMAHCLSTFIASKTRPWNRVLDYSNVKWASMKMNLKGTSKDRHRAVVWDSRDLFGSSPQSAKSSAESQAPDVVTRSWRSRCEPEQRWSNVSWDVTHLGSASY